MRRVGVATCVMLAVGCTAALTGCSDDEATKDAQPTTREVRMLLVSDADGNLKLNGAPADRSYVASYPNPDRWDSLEFVLGPDAVPIVTCTKGGVHSSCSESPFFVEYKRIAAMASGGELRVRTSGTPPASGGESTPAPSEEQPADSGEGASPPPSSDAPPASSGGGEGVSVSVSDVNGKEVAKTNVPSAPAPSGGSGGGSEAPPAVGSTCGGAAMGGAPGNGGFSKSGETRACEAASLADTPGCDAATVGAAAKVYCDAVNAQLPAGSKIDCSVLTSPTYVPSALPSSRSGGDCSTYWEPASAAVGAAGYGSCAKVSLLSMQWRDRARHELIANGACRSSPLILDLDGDGIHLSSLDEGVKFDLLAIGTEVQSAWTDGKDALLALDRNGNGRIDGASELFGDVTGDGEHADGFAALAVLDDDGNGVIDARDRVFDHLLLWRDRDRDGKSTPSELTTLREAGVRRLVVTATHRSGPSSLDAHGNSIPLVSEFERSDGTRGALVDAFLRYRPTR